MSPLVFLGNDCDALGHAPVHGFALGSLLSFLYLWGSGFHQVWEILVLIL